MAYFAYRARNDEGGLVKGGMDAENRAAMDAYLESIGLIPISIKEAMRPFDAGAFISSLEQVSTEDLILMTRQMGAMYKAGIPFARVISSLESQAQNKRLKKVLAVIGDEVEGGSSLAAALSSHTGIFDDLYIGMVEAGEAGGVLDDMFERISILLEKDNEIKEKIKSATLYPKIVVSAIVAAAFILVTFVVPKFAKLYGQFGADLPLPTKMLLAITGFFGNYWYIILILAAGIVYAFRAFVKSERGRLLWDSARLKFPIFGPLSLEASMSRFARILGTLTASGLPILMALDKSSAALGNRMISDEVEKMGADIRSGRPLSESMEESVFFPPMLVQMVAVGEESGMLDEMLINAADHLDDEVDHTIKNLSTLMEPILLSIIFVMILFLTLALFLPMWDMVKFTK